MTQFADEADERNAKLNSLATQCFLNTADNEYIVARMCYRAGLALQFNWSALHCLEKYLKAVLLYNRIPAKNRNHEPVKLTRKASKLAFFGISKGSQKFMADLEKYGGDRYLTKSYQMLPNALPMLDRSVWEVRKFCRVLTLEGCRTRSDAEDEIDSAILDLSHADPKNPQPFPLPGRRLEALIDGPDSNERRALIWHNLFFGKRSRQKIKLPTRWRWEESPGFLYPDILTEARKYVYWPTLRPAANQLAKHCSYISSRRSQK